MSLHSILDWIDEVSGSEYIWFVKYLSGNDTRANNTHQAGPYIPKQILFGVLPQLKTASVKNPRVTLDAYVDSHSDARQVNVIWYNHLTRNECRMTGWGGASSPLLDPDSTGALTVFAFGRNRDNEKPVCRIWICDHETEENIVEERVGFVVPGRDGWRTWTRSSALQRQLLEQAAPSRRSSCHIEAENIPPEWLDKFPSPTEIFNKSIEWGPDDTSNADDRLMKRRRCEFEIFQSVEEAMTLPLVRDGFENLNDFIATAQTVLQRRKARAGRSLELHVKQILIEEGFKEGRDFSWQPETERGKNPDFLFPSEASYKDLDFPSSKLSMLAVKTTARDRWRQILTEADRIPSKHLLTVQEGVSMKQFNEMSEEGVQLVIPASLTDKFPKAIRSNLKTFESFIADMRLQSF